MGSGDAAACNTIAPFSVYSALPDRAELEEGIENLPELLPIRRRPTAVWLPDENAIWEKEEKKTYPIGKYIQVAGMLACGSFFVLSYWRCSRKFKMSIPVKEVRVERWLAEHRLRRNLHVRQSEYITFPLTYGVLRPIILLPKAMTGADDKTLNYVLTHELIHIKRFDLPMKWAMAAIVCVHWFNPLVWVMLTLFNRDIELACDEAVIQSMGEGEKSGYARALISMEEVKSGFAPFYSGFNRNAIEARIKAIMKMKKVTFAAVSAAIIIAGTLTAVLATSAKEKVQAPDFVLEQGFSEEEYEMIRALKIDGYEKMSVSEYQNKLWEMVDTEQYRYLIERFSLNEMIYGKKDVDETTFYYFYVFEPLTASRWKERDFGGSQTASPFHTALLEYEYKLTISEPDVLLAGEYEKTHLGIKQELQQFMEKWTREELANADAMEEAIHTELDMLIQTYEKEGLEIAFDFSYLPLEYEPEEPTQEAWEQEMRRYPKGTEEDYKALLALKTDDYVQESISEFNGAVLEWANAVGERMDWIWEDIERNEYPEWLSPEEAAFVSQTMSRSCKENACMIKSHNTGRPEEDPWCFGADWFKQEEGNDRGSAWCQLWFQFPYHISDKDVLTVGERDKCLDGFLNNVARFWEERSVDELLGMTKEDVTAYLKETASAYSNDLITIEIDEGQVSFEHMDERNIN